MAPALREQHKVQTPPIGLMVPGTLHTHRVGAAQVRGLPHCSTPAPSPPSGAPGSPTQGKLMEDPAKMRTSSPSGSVPLTT